MSSKVNENFSENEDDPDVYESSGDEWEVDNTDKKKNNRRTSQRLSKKPRLSHQDDESSESEEVEEPKPKSKAKKAKKQQQEDSDGGDGDKAVTPANANSNPNFVNGAFVILKKDAQMVDTNKQPILWRIDGKALLQKYEAFEEDGVVKHRNTSIYTGWSPLDQDLYSPVTVKVIQHHGQNMTVELNWEKLKEINFDSD